MDQKKMVFYLSDEIFAIQTPILVTIDAQSTAIFKIELASDRSAKTWETHFKALGAHRFHSLGMASDQFDEFKALVFEKLDSVVKASSLVEMVNSLIRPYLNNSKGQITQETLNLIMFYHNHRRYKGGKRQGQAPIELLTQETLEGDWIDLLMQHKREASVNVSGTSRPMLELVPMQHGQPVSSETPRDQEVCEPSADADHGWHSTDVEAA
jgi:hypothetical protein